MFYSPNFFRSRRRFYSRPNSQQFRNDTGDGGTYQQFHRPSQQPSQPQDHSCHQSDSQEHTHTTDEAGFEPLCKNGCRDDNSTIGNMCKCCYSTLNQDNNAQNQNFYGGYYGGGFNGYNNFNGYGNYGCGCNQPLEPCNPLPNPCEPCEPLPNPCEPCNPLPNPCEPYDNYCRCCPPLFCPSYPICPQPLPIREREVQEEIREEIRDENCDRCRFINRDFGLFGNFFRRYW